jgi:hypothetical protein
MVIVHGIAIILFSMLVMLEILSKRFHDWLDRTPQYELTSEEKAIWYSIQEKATKGYDEFCEECRKDEKYWGWPWVSPGLTKEEQELVRKIHEYFYPGDYIVDPIGVSQADYLWYKEIKHKVK